MKLCTRTLSAKFQRKRKRVSGVLGQHADIDTKACCEYLEYMKLIQGKLANHFGEEYLH